MDALLQICAAAQPINRGRSEQLKRKAQKSINEANRKRRCSGKLFRKLQTSARLAQESFHDREIASMPDFRLVTKGDGSGNSAGHNTVGCGTGRWKQRTPEEVLRIGFAAPHQTLREVGHSLRPPAHHSYCERLAFTVASLYQEKQEKAIATRLATSRIIVFQMIFDEASFDMMRKEVSWNESVRLSILGLRGRLLIGANKSDHDSVAVEEEDLALRPVAMDTTAAGTMWSAFRKSVPQALWPLLGGGMAPDDCEAAALCLGQDSCSANKMLLQHIENRADSSEKIFVFPGWCKQHETGNCFQPVLERIGILPPIFCLQRRMRVYSFRKKFTAGMREGLRLNLDHVKGSQNLNWTPEPGHLEHARVILTLFYYKRDLRKSEECPVTPWAHFYFSGRGPQPEM
jgi:hypothetical protein